MFARVLFVCFIVLGWGEIQAQKYSLRHFTAVDGLPQSQVNAMVEDENGYLWIGTQGGGLARFDGKEFITYNTPDGLLSNTITSLMIDSKQNIWIIHPRGISKFDGVSFKTFSFAGSGKRVRRAFELNDSIFFLMGRPSTLGKIYNDSIYYADKPVVPNKEIITGRRLNSKQLCLYLNDSSFVILENSGARKIISHKDVFDRALNVFSYRRQLIIESNKGFYQLDADNGKLHKQSFTFDKHIVAHDSSTDRFWAYSAGSLYVEGYEDGDAELVLADVTVSQLHFDREGNTWIATNGRGLFRYSMQEFSRIPADTLASVMAMAQDKHGTIWAGSAGRGLWKIKQNKLERYPLFEKEEWAVNDIEISPTGEMWIASSYGLGQYDSLLKKFVFYTRQEGLSSQYVANLAFDKKGGLWCGTTSDGVNYFDGKKFKTYDLKTGRNIYSITYMDKYKSLFVGTELGLSKIENEEITNIELPGFPNTVVLSLNTYNDSLLLVGSEGSGIILYCPKQGIKKTITTKDGLPSNLIYFVAQDAEGYIWTGSEQGINRLKLNDKLEIVEDRHFGFESGLTGVETNQNAFFLTREKLFGIIDGVYRFNDSRSRYVKYNPLHLLSVEIFYGDFPVRKYAEKVSGFYKIPDSPVFPTDQNHLTFNFNRVDKNNPKSIHYKYFLENYDQSWSHPTEVGHVTYGKLPPGDYVLKILATNSSGRWDEQPLTYAFTIRAPFYATSTFIFLTGFLIVVIIGLILGMRVRNRMNRLLEVERIRQKEQENLRKEIARDFHDEMGNQLTRIINYISLMKISKNGHAMELYNKVEDSAKYLYSGTRDFIWSIDPLNDELSNLFIHIRDFGEKLFEEKEIKFRAFNELSQKVRTPYGFSREANLIIKEAMTNAFNHSNARNVSFTLSQLEHGYEMKLEDDGHGFSMDDIKRSNGLKNMRVRSERIKSILRIDSNSEKRGTVISLTFQKLKIQTYARTI